MSSRGRESSRGRGRRVVLQCLEDDAGESSFEGAQGLGLGVAGVEAFAVVAAAEAVAADLGDRDPVEGGVELPVAGLVDADPAVGASGPDRDRRDAGVQGELASVAKRSTPAVSPTILAAVSGPQPGSSSSTGARSVTSAVISLLERVRPRGQTLSMSLEQLTGEPGIDPGQVGQHLT